MAARLSKPHEQVALRLLPIVFIELLTQETQVPKYFLGQIFHSELKS